MKQFGSMQEAACELERALAEDGDCGDAMAYIFEHADPELKERMRRKLHEICPELKADYCDETGKVFFSEHVVKKALGLTDEQFAEAVEGLPEDCMRRGLDGLHRIN